MSNVRYLPGADIPPKQVLEGALEAELDTVLIIGKGQDGALYLASSTDHAGEVQLLMARAQAHLVTMVEDAV